MSRMAQIATSGGNRGRRILIYGPPGVGKSTLGADAPGAVVLPVEEGVDDLEVASFPRPQSWDEILEAVDVLAAGKTPHKTLVIDTVSAAETLAHRRLIEGSKWNTVEKWEGGYNKWRQGVLDICWRPLLARLDALRASTGMTVVLLAHSQVKAVRDPDSEGWDQHQIQMEGLAAGLLTAWCDVVAFYAFDDIRVVEGKARGVHTGRRVLRAEHSATAVAKNRVGLPALLEVPLAAPWSALGRYLAPRDLAKELAELTAQLPSDAAERARHAAKTADKATMGRIISHARRLVAQQQEGASA